MAGGPVWSYETQCLGANPAHQSFFTLFRLLVDRFFSAAPNDNKKHQACQVADNQSSQNTHSVLPYFYSFIRS